MSITSNHRHVVTVELAPVDPRAAAVSFLANTNGPLLVHLTDVAREYLADCYPNDAESLMDADDVSMLDVWIDIARKEPGGIEGWVTREMNAAAA